MHFKPFYLQFPFLLRSTETMQLLPAEAIVKQSTAYFRTGNTLKLILKRIAFRFPHGLAEIESISVRFHPQTNPKQDT